MTIYRFYITKHGILFFEWSPNLLSEKKYLCLCTKGHHNLPEQLDKLDFLNNITNNIQ